MYFLLRNLEAPEMPVYSVKGHKEIINTIDGVGGLGIGEGAPEIVTGSRDGESVLSTEQMFNGTSVCCHILCTQNPLVGLTLYLPYICIYLCICIITDKFYCTSLIQFQLLCICRERPSTEYFNVDLVQQLTMS